MIDESTSIKAEIKRLEQLQRKIGKMLDAMRAQLALKEDLARDLRDLMGVEGIGAPAAKKGGSKRKAKTAKKATGRRPKRRKQAADLILDLLDTSPRPLTQPDLKQGMEELGHKFSRQAISYAIRTLTESGAIEQERAEDPKAQYQYKLPKPEKASASGT